MSMTKDSAMLIVWVCVIAFIVFIYLFIKSKLSLNTGSVESTDHIRVLESKVIDGIKLLLIECKDERFVISISDKKQVNLIKSFDNIVSKEVSKPEESLEKVFSSEEKVFRNSF